MNSFQDKLDGILKQLIADRYFPVSKTGDKLRLLAEVKAAITTLVETEIVERGIFIDPHKTTGQVIYGLRATQRQLLRGDKPNE